MTFFITFGDPLRENIVKYFKHYFESVNFDFEKRIHDDRVQFWHSTYVRNFKVTKNAALSFVFSGPQKTLDNTYTLDLEIVNGSNVRKGFVSLTEDEHHELFKMVFEKYTLNQRYCQAQRDYVAEQEKVREWAEDQKAIEFLKKELRDTFDVNV